MTTIAPLDRLLGLLHDGDRCLGETQVALRRSEKLSEVVRRDGQKLLVVLCMMHQQVDAVGNLSHWVWSSNTALLARLNAVLSQDGAFVEIDAVCEQLEETKVDSRLVAGEEGHTLFDFVDDSSVSSLKLQAQMDVKEMLAVHERGAALQVVLEERLLYFRHVVAGIEEALKGPTRCNHESESADSAVSIESTGLWRAVEANIAEQADIIRNMKAGLLTAASAHARVTREAPGGQDDESAQREETELLLLLQSSIERIKELHMQMDGLPHRLHTLHQHLLALLADFESFHPEALERVSGIRGEQSRFRELGENVENHLQELESLASFYKHFHQAYAQLAQEIPRRRKALEAVREVVNDAHGKLAKLHDQEEVERTKFYNEYGMYLPASLCPQLAEPPERFHVVPSVQDSIARLPVYGKIDEEEDKGPFYSVG